MLRCLGFSLYFIRDYVEEPLIDYAEEYDV
jgi:hypothetical protein